MWPRPKNISFWAPDWINLSLLNSPSCGANLRNDFGQAVFAAGAEFISRAGYHPTPRKFMAPQTESQSPIRVRGDSEPNRVGIDRDWRQRRCDWGPIGVGAGKAAALITGKKEVSLPPETSLTFTHAEPLTVNGKGLPKEPSVLTDRAHSSHQYRNYPMASSAIELQSWR
jgi:hypothetical protein